MTTDLVKINPDTGEIIEGEATELDLVRSPKAILDEAHEAAKALKERIDNKAKPVKFNGETYLEFEDWLLLAKFYGVTVKVERSSFVEYGTVKGFEAMAVALNVKTGMAISGAEAMCLNDEPNWAKKPLFQLKSMAQTRACAKALRNVFAWVVVLAGYKPTPSEEMDGLIGSKTQAKLAVVPKVKPTSSNGSEPDFVPNYVDELPPFEDQNEVNVEMSGLTHCLFGKNNGKKWIDLKEGQLTWYKDYLIDKINDPSQDKYKVSNESSLKGVMNALLDKEELS